MVADRATQLVDRVRGVGGDEEVDVLAVAGACGRRTIISIPPLRIHPFGSTAKTRARKRAMTNRRCTRPTFCPCSLVPVEAVGDARPHHVRGHEGGRRPTVFVISPADTTRQTSCRRRPRRASTWRLTPPPSAAIHVNDTADQPKSASEWRRTRNRRLSGRRTRPRAPPRRYVQCGYRQRPAVDNHSGSPDLAAHPRRVDGTARP